VWKQEYYAPDVWRTLRLLLVGWDPASFTIEESQRWAHLRAIEWGVWPAFVSQVLFGPLCLVVTWWHVIVGVLIATWLWRFVRYRFIFVSLAGMGAVLVNLFRWILPLTSGILLLIRGDYVAAVATLIWTVGGGILPGLAGSLLSGQWEIGTFELLLLQRMHRVPRAI